MKSNSILSKRGYLLIALVALFLILTCTKKPTEPLKRTLELTDFYGSWIAQNYQNPYFEIKVLNMSNDGTFAIFPFEATGAIQKRSNSNIIVFPFPVTPISGQYNVNMELRTINFTTSDTNGCYKFYVDTVLFARDTFNFYLKWINGKDYLNSAKPDSVLWRYVKNTTDFYNLY
jgi:hypothetical protein